MGKTTLGWISERETAMTGLLPFRLRFAVALAALSFSLPPFTAGIVGNNHQFLGVRQNAINDLEPTPTQATPVASTATSTVSIAPSPSASAACIYQNDFWFCEGVRAGYESEDTDMVIAYQDGIGCLKHADHFHCPVGPNDPCAALIGDYDLPLHIVALFVLLVASALGVFFPVLLGTRAVLSKRVRDLFFILRHFGTGVLLSTAFIHLLYEAFVTFSDQCLDDLAFPPASPAIAMASMMVIFSVDFAASVRLHRRQARDRARRSEEANKAAPIALDSVESVDRLQGEERPAEARQHSEDLAERADKVFGHTHEFGDMAISVGDRYKRAKWDLQMLEAGICFHSIMIGVTLGAQGGSGFVTTLIAILFHQTLEGLGLGARIASIEYAAGEAYLRWVFCLAFTLVTPLGVAIGIAVRNTANLSSNSTLLSIGILDSISAGILLYASIASLLVAEWLAGDIRAASNKRIAAGAVALVAGLICMAVIGKWA